jgi:hypothetical protein
MNVKFFYFLLLKWSKIVSILQEQEIHLIRAELKNIPTSKRGMFNGIHMPISFAQGNLAAVE